MCRVRNPKNKNVHLRPTLSTLIHITPTSFRLVTLSLTHSSQAERSTEAT